MIPIYLSYLILSLFISKAFTGTIFTPIGLFGVLWNGLLIMFEVRLLEYDPISTTASAFYLLSYGSFLIGGTTVLIAQKITQSSRKVPGKAWPWMIDYHQLVVMRRIIYIYGVISAIGTTFWIAKLFSVVGFDALLGAA